MNKKIWLSSPHMGGTEQDYVNEAFETNWIAPLGPNVNEFENKLEQYLGNDSNIAALASGTSAIHLALVLAGVGLGDEVLCQSFTFSASANPITYQGAIPVFVDSEYDTWNMCPILLENAIKDRIQKKKKPKAIIVVHLYGMPAKMDEINALSAKYEIQVIEDAAEALGSVYKGSKCATLADYGVLSFNGNKIITTSGGGALVCKSLKQKQVAIFLATQARDDAPHYQHSKIGYNYRMSNVVAGIGRGQMEVLQDHVDARRANFDFYKLELNEIEEIEFLEEPKNVISNRWLSCVLTSSFELRESIRLNLEKANIEARPLWKPMHTQPVFEKCTSFTNNVSEHLFERGLCLPSGSNLETSDLKQVIKIIKQSINDFKNN
ncbi:DegT/DnrJ/EryC1/StrS family aminotransferase [Flavicella sediminum]|uniref:DegT/DnrJ/EryC1/StrS family aminotransferase n=1 Tax=Flavicella sediminum TaxID=2585141 RepID=UPI00112479DA|nr:DegT/DnrJ/EryC1/StrS family aminotransferase [Flavicella sediminum]